jgi:hypothetical protein
MVVNETPRAKVLPLTVLIKTPVADELSDVIVDEDMPRADPSAKTVATLNPVACYPELTYVAKNPIAAPLLDETVPTS